MMGPRRFFLHFISISALLSPAAFAQPGRPTGPAAEGIQLDLQGKGAEARQKFQEAIDAAATPAAKANAQRAMAMSWAFDGNCKKTGEYEQMVIDYWITQEKDQPGNAFYQEGEMANEAARVCIDSGDLNAAAEWYKKGHDLGLKEPGISPDRTALWEYRTEHALARIAARRGNRADAEKHVALARAALDKMTELRKQQEPFLPYLTGYVAFYLGDYKAALADFQKAQNDPFIQVMIGQTYEKLGDKDQAMEYYRKASSARAHNPPAAYAVPFARKKLASS
jgi:tetratricopeptide (TPR) repeat protein